MAQPCSSQEELKSKQELALWRSVVQSENVDVGDFGFRVPNFDGDEAPEFA